MLSMIGFTLLASASCGFYPVVDDSKDAKASNEVVFEEGRMIRKEMEKPDNGNGEVHLHAHGENGHPHIHSEWIAPPAAYADYRSDRWADLKAMSRGKKIYEQQCISCHGADGGGGGKRAAGLSHPAADLTNHFHKLSGEGDAYMFWRVSEGGAVEPFFSMLSEMPPFKNILSEDERWEVLAFIHGYFHLGLVKWKSDVIVKDVIVKEGVEEHINHHDHDGHTHQH